MKRLIKFSSLPYRIKQDTIRLMEENKRAFQKEMAERHRWKIKNNFDEEPYIKDWDKHKKKNRRQFEKMMIGAISIVDAAESASSDLATGLGLKGTLIDMDAVEDLVTNIYLVKLAEHIGSDQGANLSQRTQSAVIQALIGQIFPPAVPIKPPPTPNKGEEILERVLAIKNGARA